MKHNRAITSYPVFLITTIALLAITMLTITSINNLENSFEAKPGREVVEYHVIGGKLYLKTNIDPPIKEIIITNNSSIIIDLNPYNGYYGPVILPDNASMIIITGRSPEQKPVILDILRKLDNASKYMLVNHGVLPPSILIDSSGNIIPVDQYNATKTYRRLVPYIYRRGPLKLCNNTVYRVNTDGTIHPIHKTSWISLGEYSGNTSDLTQTFKEYLNRYGYIRINYSIPLNIYPYNKTIPLYEYKVLVYTSSSLPIIIPYYNELGTINTTNPVVAYIRIENTILSTRLRDSQGRNYPVHLKIYYRLILANEQGTIKTVTNITEHNGTGVFRDVLKSILLVNGTMRITLEIIYEIDTSSPIYSTPLYASVNYILSGGYDRFTTTLYNPDTIVVGTSEEAVRWVPEQNTTLNLVLTGNLWHNSSECIIQNSESAIYNVSYILLRPVVNKTYNYTIEAFPSILIVKPDNINLEFSNNAPLIARNLSENTIFIGLNSSLLNVSITVKPCVIVNETMILLGQCDRVYLFSDGNNDKIVIAGPRGITTINLGHDYSLVNLVIEETIRYRDPIILLKNTIHYNISVAVRITVSFIDNSSVEVIAEGPQAIDLGIDKPIIGLNISINASPSPHAVFWSMKTIILVDDNGVAHMPVEAVKTRIFGLEYYILVAPDTVYAYPA